MNVRLRYFLLVNEKIWEFNTFFNRRMLFRKVILIFLYNGFKRGEFGGRKIREWVD